MKHNLFKWLNKTHFDLYNEFLSLKAYLLSNMKKSLNKALGKRELIYNYINIEVLLK